MGFRFSLKSNMLPSESESLPSLPPVPFIFLAAFKDFFALPSDEEEDDDEDEESEDDLDTDRDASPFFFFRIEIQFRLNK